MKYQVYLQAFFIVIYMYQLLPPNILGRKLDHSINYKIVKEPLFNHKSICSPECCLLTSLIDTILALL